MKLRATSSPENIDEALQWATEGFCDEEVVVDAKKGTVRARFILANVV